MQLYQAAHQWATRPADERFSTLDEMYAVTKAYADQATEKTVPWADLRVEAAGENMHLVGRAGVPALLTNYAFGQLANRAGAPAEYLRRLPATLAAQNVNHGLKARAEGPTDAQLLFHRNGSLVLRAVTSDRYARIWNHEIVSRTRDLAGRFSLVPARTTMGGTDNPDGLDMHGVASRALYASDRDMFAFLMTPDRSVTGPSGPMFRGIFIQNSEVGDAALKLTGFWFVEVCYNHIVWGAENLAEVSLRHVGQVRSRWLDAVVTVRRYLDRPATADTARFTELVRPIAGDRDAVLDAVFAVRSVGLSRAALGSGYDAVVPAEDGDPNSRWGLAQGLTRYSQTIAYANERTAIDRAAGRLLTF